MEKYEVLAVDYRHNKVAIAYDSDYRFGISVVDLGDISDHLHPCHECGELHPIGEMERIDGWFVCQHCKEAYFVVCGECHSWARRSETRTAANGRILCDHCVRTKYETCEKCGELFAYGEYLYVEGDCYCNHCLEELISSGDVDMCAHCEEYFYSEDLYYNEEDDCYYCADCEAQISSEYISSYHYGREFRFKSLRSVSDYPKSANMYIGVEHELSHVGDTNGRLAKKLVENFDRVCESDGSINNGFEVISDALTFPYWKKYEDLHSYMEECIEAGFEPDRSSGIHVHLSRAPLSEKSVEEIASFVMNNYMKCIKFGRRMPTSRATYYCRYKKFTDICDLEDHYSAVNLEEESNIELRFFQTTDDVEHMWAIIEFAHCIAEVSKDEEEITWEKLREYAVSDGQCQNFIAELDNDFDCDEIDGYDYDIDPEELA